MATSRRSASGQAASRRAAPAGLGEWEIIDVFRRHLGRVVSPGVDVGIGDDAAVLGKLHGQRLVVSVDSAVEHVHFDRRWVDLPQIAARALHAAVSDLAAMGAAPLGALSALHLPPGYTRREIDALARGQARASRELSCPVIGGNVSRAEILSITTTVLGTARRPLLRSGARAGDEVWLVGEVGLASVGLHALMKGGAKGSGGAVTACVRAWREPRARLADGIALGRSARACIDVSDGFAADLRHLATASGVRIEIDHALFAAALSPVLREACRTLGLDPLQQALSGGEDYALIATGPSRARPEAAKLVGRVRKGNGTFIREPEGKLRRLTAPGYTHTT